MATDELIEPTQSFDHACGFFMGIVRAMQIEYLSGGSTGASTYVPLLRGTAVQLLKLYPAANTPPVDPLSAAGATLDSSQDQ